MAIEAALDIDGVSVQDGFLGISEVRALAACVRVRRERGEFAAARVGAAARLARREEVRGDFTCWIAAPLMAAEQALLRTLERVRLEFNGKAMLGLFDLEVHYAWYPPGAGYARHVDQPQGRAQRQVSLVLYLNEHWAPEAGGALRLFDSAGAHRDVDPIAGRLVCFLTPGREHAVLPTRCDRFSISGWFRTRDPAGV